MTTTEADLLAALKALVENPRPATASGGDDWNERYARYEAAWEAGNAIVLRETAASKRRRNASEEA